jgi:hypothetical protein
MFRERGRAARPTGLAVPLRLAVLVDEVGAALVMRRRTVVAIDHGAPAFRREIGPPMGLRGKRGACHERSWTKEKPCHSRAFLRCG